MAKALSGSAYRMVALGFVAMFAASAHAQETTGQRQGQIIVSRAPRTMTVFSSIDRWRGAPVILAHNLS
jgi:hypothetical protein